MDTKPTWIGYHIECGGNVRYFATASSGHSYCLSCGMDSAKGVSPEYDDGGPSVSYNASRPGQRFKPDGSGGGILYVTKIVERRGFRPIMKTIEIHKIAHGVS